MKQRNRAKCRLCGDIVESIMTNDVQMCGCGEIGVDGGLDVYRGIFGDPKNFIRIEDDGSEKEVVYQDRLSRLEENSKAKEWIKASTEDTIRDNTELPNISKAECIDMLKLHIEGFDNLPDHAKYQPASVYDVQCLAMMIYGILRN